MTKLVEKDPIHIVEEDNIQPPPHYQEGGPPQIVTADTARQAPAGVPVLWVLVGGLAAVAIGWLIVDFFVR